MCAIASIYFLGGFGALKLTALLTSAYTCKLWLRCFAQFGGRAHGTPNLSNDHTPQVDSWTRFAFALLIFDVVCKVSLI